MLSIIISSYNSNYFNSIINNIKETIGEDIIYEVVKIDNNKLFSLCEAYNIGGKKSKYDNLLFIHEDVIFETKNWGSILINLLGLKNCGAVGVAGGNYYGFVPGSWWNDAYKFLHFKQVSTTETTFNNRVNFNKDNEEAIAIDGVFMACKKKIFDEISFDERINGYHGYDLIFSLQVSKKYQNYVTSEILLKHYSSGNLNKEWFENILKVRSIIGYDWNSKIDKEVELKKFYSLINYLKKYEYSYLSSLRIILKFMNIKILGLKGILKVVNRIKYL